MAAPRIVFKDVVKRFRSHSAGSLRDAIPRALGRLLGRPGPAGFTALDGVSFEVPPGEALGIVGVNGSGKSTTLRLAAGIYTANGGDVLVQGRVAAMIELSAGFHPDLSGRENVYLNAALLGLARRETAARFDEIVAFADIGEHLEQPVRTYSSGMAVRLGFAVAAHVPAEVLLVDEVLAVGDVAFQRRCLTRIAELRADGVSVLFVSHNMSVVEQFCDRVIWIDGGRVVADGDPTEVVDQYRHEVLARDATGGSGYAARREGTGALRIDGVGFEAAGGGPPCAGGPLRVCLTWSAAEPVRGCIAGIAIHGPHGEILAEVRSAERGDAEVVHHGSGAMVFHVPRLPLLPGTYDVTVYARDATGLVNLDYVRGVYRLTVEGRRGAAESGSLHLAGAWDLLD